MHNLHRQMYQWAANTGEFKSEWHGFIELDIYVMQSCFACETAVVRAGRHCLQKIICQNCPIKWCSEVFEFYCQESTESIYNKYFYGDEYDDCTTEEMKDLAAQIRDMEWTLD